VGLKALVTGGGGPRGSHLVQALLAGGHEAGVLDDFSTGDISNLTPVLGQHSYADIARISSVLGYRPADTIESGLAEVIEWWKSLAG